MVDRSKSSGQLLRSMALPEHPDVAIEMEKNVKKRRQSPVEPHKCPRCDSENTKFCYYNNYSLSQPRYFCKACKRYWTKGGVLRNVPFGGGGGKNKRGRKSDALMSTTTTAGYGYGYGYCMDRQFTPLPASLLTATLNHQLQHEMFFGNGNNLADGLAGIGNRSIFHDGLYGNQEQYCSFTNHGGIQEQTTLSTLPSSIFQVEPPWIIGSSSSSSSTSYSSIPLYNQHGYCSFW